MATISNKEGLLDYGDNDGTVIWQSPMTSEALISTPLIGGGTYNKVGTGHLFDSVKGLNPGASGYYYIDNITNNAKLQFGGQYTFEVETAVLACSAAASEGSSGGVAQVGSETLMGFAANPPNDSNWITNVSITNKSFQMACGYGTSTATGSTLVSDVIGKSQFSTITVAWSGNVFRMFINGVAVFTVNRPVNFHPFYSLYLGRYPLWWAATQPLTSGYIRNLQVSTRPYAMSSHPILARVQVFGDSFAEGVYISQTPVWDMEKSLNMEKEFYKIGIQFGSFNPQPYGGRKVIGSGNAALYLIDNVATALAQRPTCPIFQAGANDLTTTGTLDVTAFTNGMKAIVERFFGVNGNPSTTVQRMLVCSTPWPPNYPNATDALLRKPDISSIQTIQSGLPAWFDAAYPALAGRLAYQDTFTDFGGFNPDPAYYGVSDALHPIHKGRYVMGKSWASGVKKLMRN